MMGTTSKGPIFGAVAVLALLAACLVVVMKIELAPSGEERKGPVRNHLIGEGIHLSRSGLYGVDLVSIGKAELGGLRLTNGWSIENGVLNVWKTALLAVTPKLGLRYY